VYLLRIDKEGPQISLEFDQTFLSVPLVPKIRFLSESGHSIPLGADFAFLCRTHISMVKRSLPTFQRQNSDSAAHQILAAAIMQKVDFLLFNAVRIAIQCAFRRREVRPFKCAIEIVTMGQGLGDEGPGEPECG
jgi:hypothetical protein